MTDITKITDHENQALKRRMEQWKEKPNMEKVLKAFIGGYPEMEDMFFDLLNKTFNINLAEGEQLDNLGRIVNQPRLNFADDFYRILLLTRIGINVSEGEPARIISTFKILTQANFVHYMNLFDGEVALGTDGTIDIVTINFLLQNMEKVLMGGVRLDYIAEYVPENSFAMDGNNVSAPAGGFGTIVDGDVGGKLAKIHTISNSFSFDGNNTSDGGFGTIYDPLVGGVFK